MTPKHSHADNDSMMQASTAPTIARCHAQHQTTVLLSTQTSCTPQLPAHAASCAATHLRVPPRLAPASCRKPCSSQPQSAPPSKTLRHTAQKVAPRRTLLQRPHIQYHRKQAQHSAGLRAGCHRRAWLMHHGSCMVRLQQGERLRQRHSPHTMRCAHRASCPSAVSSSWHRSQGNRTPAEGVWQVGMELC